MAADPSRRQWANLSDEALFEIVRRIPCEFDRVCRTWRRALPRLKLPPPPPPLTRFNLPAPADPLLPGLKLLVAPPRIKFSPPHPPLPLLLLPEDDGHGFAFSCVLSESRAGAATKSECRTHPFSLPPVARRAHWFGSYDGAWLFLAAESQGARDRDHHLLVNLRNFQQINLPNEINMLVPEEEDEPPVMETGCIGIVAATLSRPPTEERCIVAAIIELPNAAHRIAF
uniref:F-box domain-containing protein n=1 Tax=Leersia perrieri TaxID=77586 RepID=A0A0D9WJ58_9ORYZ